jgi:single-stranded DNA-binding protein
MAGETHITIVGNLADDPELRYTPVSRGFANSEARCARNSRVGTRDEPSWPLRFGNWSPPRSDRDG